jgi:hypothetical protein
MIRADLNLPRPVLLSERDKNEHFANINLLIRFQFFVNKKETANIKHIFYAESGDSLAVVFFVFIAEQHSL